LHAKRFLRDFSAAFMAKCKEAIMQHTFIGDWAQQPHLSAEHRSSMHGLNRRFLDLAGEGVVAPGLAAQVAPLSPAQRTAAADCPYALFDLRFQDDAHWRSRLQTTVAWRIAEGSFAVPRAILFDRAKLMRMLAVNRDIMIRTAALIVVFLFFTAKGARDGDVTLAANSVLNNFLLVSAFFLDGLANAAQQLCGRAFGAHDRKGFSDSTRLVLLWGTGFALVVSILFALFGPGLIDLMTTSAEVRRTARDFLLFVILAPLPGVFAFGFDGIYVGATWAREMRNLMLLSLVIFLAIWWALSSFGNAGLWTALLGFYIARGGLQGARYPALFGKTFQAM